VVEATPDYDSGPIAPQYCDGTESVSTDFAREGKSIADRN
jgi:hypothetical protein